MNDPTEALAPLAALLGESRLMADRYQVIMPDGSQRYGEDGVVDMRSTHRENRAVQKTVADLQNELARIQAQLERLWHHVSSAIADEEDKGFDQTLATLSALRDALVPVDPDAGLGMGERLNARIARLDQALRGRGDSDELKHWNADGAGRVRVVEDACILLIQAAGYMGVDADLADSVRHEVEGIRLALVGRPHRGGKTMLVLWQNEPHVVVDRVTALMERLVVRISSI